MMPLAIDVGGLGGVAVAECHGRIVHGETARMFTSRIAALLATDSLVVLDLSGVTYADAGGLGALAGLLGRAGGSEGRLFVTSVPARVAHLMHLTRLDSQVRTIQPRASREGTGAAAGAGDAIRP